MQVNYALQGKALQLSWWCSLQDVEHSHNLCCPSTLHAPALSCNKAHRKLECVFLHCMISMNNIDIVVYKLCWKASLLLLLYLKLCYPYPSSCKDLPCISLVADSKLLNWLPGGKGFPEKAT